MSDPGYVRVLNYLKKKIEAGIYRPEEKLPEQDQLALENEVSIVAQLDKPLL